MSARPSPGLEVRRLTYADLPQVTAIERRCFPAPWSLAMFVLELGKPGAICLAATCDGALVGYVICARMDTVWHVMNVSTAPEHRRRGIATTLLVALLERIDDEDAQLTLEVRGSNRAAVALYARFGFAEAGVRRRYYSDNGEDAQIMWRTPATLRGSLEDVPGQ